MRCTKNYLSKMFVSIESVQSLAAPQRNLSDTDVCWTSECDAAAQYAGNAIDPSADPCDDFYEFACGNFRSPQDTDDTNKPTIDSFAHLESLIYDQLKTMIAESERRRNESPVFEHITQLYEACVNAFQLLLFENTDYFKSIIKLDGGWNYFKFPRFMEGLEWEDLVGPIKNAGFTMNYLFDTRVEENFFQNSSKRAIMVTANSFNYDFFNFHFFFEIFHYFIRSNNQELGILTGCLKLL